MGVDVVMTVVYHSILEVGDDAMEMDHYFGVFEYQRGFEYCGKMIWQYFYENIHDILRHIAVQ